MRHLPRRFYAALRRPLHILSAIQRHQRLAQAGCLPELQAFWRNQGREWITFEASESELDLLDALAQQTVSLSNHARRKCIVAAFHEAWAETFRQSGEGIDWDTLQEELPDAALVCFYEGALHARKDRINATQ